MKTIKTILGIALMVFTLFKADAAAWEGTDDFSRDLAKWDTIGMHYTLPSDGLFLTNSCLQFIKSATSTNLADSVDQAVGVLIWPQSLPNNTNWVVTVDAHLKPLSVMGSVLKPNSQDIIDRVHFSGPVHELVLGHG